MLATPLVSRSEQVNFTPRRLLTDGSRIREDFRNFSIASLQPGPPGLSSLTLPASDRLPIFAR